jgi:hypothetical protein
MAASGERAMLLAQRHRFIVQRLDTACGRKTERVPQGSKKGRRERVV